MLSPDSTPPDASTPATVPGSEIRAAASAPHGIPATDRYPGTCRELTDAERRQRERSGRPPALRVRAEGIRVTFKDRLLGRKEYEVDDFVVRRNDGTPGYQLAVMVDDAAQGIGEVVRGADLVDSTPRQLVLARMLGLSGPNYAHVPLVLGPDGKSARQAPRRGNALRPLRASGEGVGKVLGWMAASLGLAKAGEEPSPADLLARFDPSRLPLEADRVLSPGPAGS